MHDRRNLRGFLSQDRAKSCTLATCDDAVVETGPDCPGEKYKRFKRQGGERHGALAGLRVLRRQHDPHRLLDERMNCESFAVSERWPDEGHVNRTVPQSLDQVSSVALHWQQQHVRISSPIGLNESRHTRLEVGCARESDPDVSGFAACPISNVCLCPFHLLQNCRASSSSSVPGSVSSTPRVRRRNSGVPNSCSNCLICRLSGGCLMPSRSAALVKFRSSATATK